MKKNLSAVAFTFATAFLAACSSPKSDGFTVELNLKNIPDCDVFVSERMPNPTARFVDTLEFKNGKAVYEGKVAFPRLTVFNFKKDKDNYGTVEVLLDNSGKVQIIGDEAKNVTITGCQSQDEFNQLKKELATPIAQISDISKQYSAAFKNKATKEELEALRQAKDEAKLNLAKAFVALPGYEKSEIVGYFIYSNFYSNLQGLEKSLEKLDPSLDGNGYVQGLKAQLSRLKTSSIGHAGFNFSLKDVNGKEYHLSDFKGKYVFIEFSASWCGWCKKEIPFLKQAYEDNKDKNFVMLTLNLDVDQKKWEDDVKKHDLPWPVISDLKGFKGDAAQAYNVHGIPMTYLLDQDGIIIKKGLRGDDMIRTLKEIVK